MAFTTSPRDCSAPWLSRPQMGQTGPVDLSDDAIADLFDSPDDVNVSGVRALVYALRNQRNNSSALKDPTQPPDWARNLAQALMDAGAYTPLASIADGASSQGDDRLTLRGGDADDTAARVQQFINDGLGPPDPMAVKMLELGKTSFADQFVATPYPDAATSKAEIAAKPEDRDNTSASKADRAAWVGGYDLPEMVTEPGDAASNPPQQGASRGLFMGNAGRQVAANFDIPPPAFLGALSDSRVNPEMTAGAFLSRVNTTHPRQVAATTVTSPAAPIPAAPPPQSLTSDILGGLNDFRQRLDEVGEDPGTLPALRVAAAAVRAPASFIPNAAAGIAAPVGYIFDRDFRHQVNSGVGRFLANRPVETIANTVGNYARQRASAGAVGGLEALRDATELVGAGIPTGSVGKVAGAFARSAAETGAHAVKSFGPRFAQITEQRFNHAGTIKYPIAEETRLKSRNGYTYAIDKLGRTTNARGSLTRNSAQTRNARAQLHAGGSDRLQTDEGGHFVGRRFNGPLDAFNHFAQDMNLNRGTYKALENTWQRALDRGQSVYIDIKPTYVDKSLRPSTLDINYTIDGIRYWKRYQNHPGGK